VKIEWGRFRPWPPLISARQRRAKIKLVAIATIDFAER